MDNSYINDENTPRHNALQNEKRKPLESPFSAFSPAQRLAKKKGRILSEPGDSNLEASMMDESILHTEHTDSFEMPKALKPKVLFAEGDGADQSLSGEAIFDLSVVEATQTDGDRTFSAETRPVVPASVDPNLDETYAEMSMNQTFSDEVLPVVPSSADRNLDETLVDMTMNETFSNIVGPVVPSAVDPNMDETLAETTINQTQLSMADESALFAEDDEDLADDADRTLGETEKEVNEREETPLLEELNEQDDTSEVADSKVTVIENGEGETLFEEINTIEVTVPIDLSSMKDEEEKSTVEASQEHSLIKEGGMSLYDELNTGSSTEWMEEEKMADMTMNRSEVHEGGTSLFDEMNEMSEDSPLDESVLSTMTARGISDEEARRIYYTKMKERVAAINVSFAPQTPQVERHEQEEVEEESTPTRSDTMMAVASPASEHRASHGFSLSNTILDSPGTPSRNSRFNNMNDSHISFIIAEAECTNSVYMELKKDMQALQEELNRAREHTETVERERDNARKEVDDYMFMMETTKKRLMSEKTNLTKQILDLEGELTEARRMSSVVEEEGRKVEEMERMKSILEEQKKELEEKMKEESEKYALEQERFTARAVEMEKLIEEERKKANEEMERRVMECRGELERKVEEILRQKNELINQLEKKECESGEMEYTTEENERRLEGEKAMMETMMANSVREKKEMEEELERVRREKEETTKQMAKLAAEFDGVKKVIVEMEELRSVAFEESRHAAELNGEVEELKRENEMMKRGMEEKEKEVLSLRSTIDVSTVTQGRLSEMEERVRELEKEKGILEMDVKRMKMETEMAGTMESRMEDMMNGLMKKTDEHFKETTALKEEIIDLKKMKIMETEVEMKAKERELEVNEEMRKGMEKEIERMKEETRIKIESMEDTNNALKKDLDETTKALLVANENGMTLEQKIVSIEECATKRMMDMKEEKENEVKEMMRLQEQITTLTHGKKTMEEELEKKNGEMEMMMREVESEKEKVLAISQSEEALREKLTQLEEERQRLATAESSLASVSAEKEEMERRAIEENAQKEERIRMMQKEMEEMREQMETMHREHEIVKANCVSQSEEAVREMHTQLEETRQRLANAECALRTISAEKEEVERKRTEENEEKEEKMRMTEREKEEMKERMEAMQREHEMVKLSTCEQSNKALMSLQMELESEREEKKAMALRLTEVESEKMEVEKSVEIERERNDVLSATVKQLENELDQKSPGVSGMDEEERKRLEKELEEEKETVAKLEKEVKRLEDMCDVFDEVEYKLKEALMEKQKKIDALEGKTKTVGPSLLDALKPTTTEIRAMDETVVDSRQASPPREVAGKDEKEDEEMKEEYGTPSGSMMDEEDRKEVRDADETLGVTKMDATRYDMDEEEYEKTNQTRPNASCRQS